MLVVLPQDRKEGMPSWYVTSPSQIGLTCPSISVLSVPSGNPLPVLVETIFLPPDKIMFCLALRIAGQNCAKICLVAFLSQLISVVITISEIALPLL